jgi:CheY-like chemotaxis protein
MGKRGEPIVILYAEDDEEDRMLVKDALKESRLTNELHIVEDGEELMDYLHRRGKYSELHNSRLPGLILLDLNMPKKDGREALKEIKAHPSLRRIPVVVLTTSKAEEDILRTYDLGVSGFIVKPVTFESFVDVIKTLGKYWFELVELPNELRITPSPSNDLRAIGN